MERKLFDRDYIFELYEAIENIEGKKFDADIRISEELNDLIMFDNGVMLFSERMANHPQMPETVVDSVLVLFYCLYFFRELSADYFEKKAEEICGVLGMKYIRYDDMEVSIRSVRRSIFPDSKNGGCRFRIGDKLVYRRPGYGRGKYQITDISPITEDGIIITYNRLDSPKSVFTDEEAVIFDMFISVE